MAERGTAESEWIVLASKFPASLDKDSAPESLADGETPEAYGMGIDKPNYLYAESAPSSGTVGTQISTVSAPTNAPSGITNWRFFHNRLWGWSTSSSKLYYSAYGYDSNYILQNLGYVSCDTESSNIVDVIPFGDNVAVLKSDYLYVINNANNPDGDFVATYIKQASGLPTAGKWVVIDNLVVYANTHGIFSFDGQNITELTYPIRNNLGTFSDSQVSTLRADFEKRRIVGRGTSDTKFIIELGQQARLYNYSTSGFRFTTRTLAGANGETMVVDKLGLIYQYEGDKFYLNIDVKINDTWKTEDKFTIRPANENCFATLNIKNVLSCRKFAVRLTSLDANVYINSIMAHLKQGGVMGYSNK